MTATLPIVHNVNTDRKIVAVCELPDGWESAVFSWFWDNDQSAVENCDDQGGYPSEDQLREAFDALGYQSTDDDDESDD